MSCQGYPTICALTLTATVILVVLTSSSTANPLPARTLKSSDLEPATIHPFQFLETPNNTRASEHRTIRSTSDHTVTPSCQTESAWVKLHHAFDLYKNRVEVLPSFEQNNTVVEQVFNERYCAGDSLSTDGAKAEHHHRTLLPTSSSHRAEWSVMLGRQTCYGIDRNAYQGYCVTQHSFVYAMVKNQRGEVGWNVIRVRGGCECAVFNAV